MKPTLLILAAGMASRYGSMKQTAGFGPNEETIMDYSIYSALEAGFGKVVFIIRKEFAEGFKSAFADKLSGKINIDFVYQELESYTDPEYLPAQRTKPWGTGHALLCAQDKVHEPFAVINADDFYGKDSFKKAADFLMNDCSENKYAVIGYYLSKTLSEHGTVSRGVCETDAHGNLSAITERTKIYRGDNGIVFEENDQPVSLPDDTIVSMNFWCFHPSVFALAEKLFLDFPKNNMDNPKAEFFIPYIAQYFIANQKGAIEVISTASDWFGVTYKEDAPGVKAALHTLISAGEYPEKLWG